MRLRRKPHYQNGLTILEVLIALVVITSVIMGAYLVAQRSALTVRSGQEHSEVLQILQGQVEHVRALALAQSTDSGGIFADGDFCIDARTVPFKRVPATDVACTDIQEFYDISVSYNSTTKVFTFVGKWDRLGGGTNQEQLAYRVYAGKLNVVSSAPGGGGASPNGNALFDDRGFCGRQGQPSCSTINPNGSYQYDVAYYNESTNPVSDIDGCTWDWGDGIVQDYTGPAAPCLPGARVTHAYPLPTNPRPYPEDCNQQNYFIVLTMRIKGVSPNPAWGQYALMAFCAR